MPRTPNPFAKPTNDSNVRRAHIAWIISGYALAAASLFIVPIIGVIGVAIGIKCRYDGSEAHGLAIMILSILLALIDFIMVFH